MAISPLHFGVAASKAISKIQENIAGTSKPCAWNVPAGKGTLEPQQIHSVEVCEHEYGRVENIKQKNIVMVEHPGNLNVLYNKVKEVEEWTGQDNGFEFDIST